MNKPDIGISYGDVRKSVQETMKMLSHLGVPASVIGEAKKDKWLQRKIAFIRFSWRLRKH